MNNIDESKLYGFELVAHIALEQALKTDDHKAIFGTDGKLSNIHKYFTKYDEYYKIYIRKYTEDMSGSVGGDYEIYVEERN